MHPGNTEYGATAIAQKHRIHGVNSPHRRVFHPLKREKTLIFYQLSSYFADVDVSIYDLSGKIQKNYSQGSQDSGIYQIPANVIGLSSGIYFVSLTGNNGAGEKLIGMFKLAIRH